MDVLKIRQPVDDARAGAAHEIGMRDDVETQAPNQSSRGEFGVEQLPEDSPDQPPRVTPLKQTRADDGHVRPIAEHHVQGRAVDIRGDDDIEFGPRVVGDGHG